MTTTKIYDGNINKLAEAMKKVLECDDLINCIPEGYGFERYRDAHRNIRDAALFEVNDLVKYLELTVDVNALWTIAKAAVAVDYSFRLNIAINSKVEQRRIDNMIDERATNEMFDAEGILCNFERSSTTSWK